MNVHHTPEKSEKSKKLPPQRQARQPGIEREMRPRPDYTPKYPGCGKLKDKVAVITGGDSGIGRAVAVAMAREGALISILYLNEHEDAKETARLVEAEGSQAILFAGDVGDEMVCWEAVERTFEEFGRIDILVNNAAEQHETKDPLEIDTEQLQKTFRTNVFGYFYMAKAALHYMQEGACIINTTSITAYRGHKTLIDYAATKGAILSFTRSLSEALEDRNIRVNGVAPGPIWTPLIPASFDAKKVAEHGQSAPMKRPGQPNEVAPCYVFLASEDASYMSGQVLHPNGGSVVNA
jgi:NAD(P)-dependent dehydrogenase (short-subunit alcohol dehydrogenase family)